MAFIRFASSDLLQAEIARPGQGLMRTAHKHSFDYTPREGFLYVRSRAISSRTNDNFDTFPAEEIKKAWATFIGKPVFVNHHNDDHRRARGVIIDAALHEDIAPDRTPDTWVEVLMEIDAVNFPKLAAAILAGDIERTSMGTDVQYSICSACGNKASTPVEYCSHIPRLKGKKIRRRTASGDGAEDVLVHEVCCGLSFFENSVLVEPPADPTAHFLGVDSRGVTGMSKAASRKIASAGTMEIALTLLNGVPDYLHERIKRLLPFIVNGPEYNRGVDEELMTAIRMGDRDNGYSREWFLRKAESKAHYQLTGEWIKPVHPGDEDGSKDQMSLFAARKGDGIDACKFCGSEDLFSGFFDQNGMASDGQGQHGGEWDTTCSNCGRFQHRRNRRVSSSNQLTDEDINSGWGEMFDDSQDAPSDSFVKSAKKYKDNYKGNTTERGYGWDHQKKREELLKGNPKCHHCKKNKATQADHYGGGLVPSCADCNNKRSHEQKKRKNKKKGAVMQGSGGVAMLPIGEVQPGMVVRRWSSHDWGLVVETKISQIRDRSKDDRQVFVTLIVTDPTNPSGPQWKIEGEWREEVQVASNSATASRRLAYGEVKAPASIDTLRIKDCPVCGEDESWDGDGRCRVCGYVPPPEPFREPDLEVAQKVDMRGDSVNPELFKSPSFEPPEDEEDEEGEDGKSVAKSARRRIAFNQDRLTRPLSGGLPVGTKVMVYRYTAPMSGVIVDGLHVPAIEVMFGGDRPQDGVYTILFDDGSESDAAKGSVVPVSEFRSAWHVYSEDGRIIAGGPSISRQRAEELAKEKGGIVRQGGRRRTVAMDLTHGPERPSRGAGVRWEGMASSQSSGYEVDVLWPGDEVMLVSAYINDQERAHEWAKMAYEAGAADVYVTEIGPYSTRSVVHVDRRTASRPVLDTRTPMKYQRHSSVQGEANMRPTVATAARQQQIIQIQADRINRLERQVNRLRRFADANNPAQPVAEPGSQAPAATTDQTRAADQTINLLQPGGVMDAQQAQVIQLTTPGGVMAAPQAIQQDVTAPVNGYQQPVADMRTEVDVNHDGETIGENAYSGDWANAGGQATAQARTFAALRLARLRIEAGIAEGDDITLAQRIATSRVSNAQIRTEIDTLSKVRRSASTRRTASNIRPQAVRNVPSLVSTAAPVVAVAAPSMNPSADEFLFD